MGEHRWPACLGGFALLVVAGTAADVGSTLEHDPLVATVETAVRWAATFTLLAGAVHLHQRSFEAASGRRVVGWTLAGTVLVAGVGILVLFSGSTVSVRSEELLEGVTVGGGVGAALGFFVGLLEARSMEETRDVERARSRAREEAQVRETVEYLNALLRHNVLNAANVISGTVRELRDRSDVDHEAELRTVEARGEEMVDLATNVRTLLRAATADREVRPVHLAGTVEHSVATLRSQDPEATVTVAVPDDLAVAADGFLRDGVAALLSAAAGYGGAPPTLSVAAERADGRVHLRVTADGRVPPRIQRRPFAATYEGDDDVRLVLVGVVVDPYGEATLAEADGQETVFRLSFEPADVDEEDDDGNALTDSVPGSLVP
jgi:signal transduction histidine kinase